MKLLGWLHPTARHEFESQCKHTAEGHFSAARVKLTCSTVIVHQNAKCGCTCCIKHALNGWKSGEEEDVKKMRERDGEDRFVVYDV